MLCQVNEINVNVGRVCLLAGQIRCLQRFKRNNWLTLAQSMSATLETQQVDDI